MRRSILAPLLLLLAVLAAGGGFLWHRMQAPAAAEHSAGRGGRRGNNADDRPTPVLIAQAERRDVPIWLDGLGTVQASATVTVRPQVDGPLIEVGFREGQDVRAGDVLARIDPRPFQATLDQYAAKKQQDEANLANARVDAARYARLAQQQFSSAQQADTARAQVAQLEAQVRGDQAQIDSARTQLGYTTIAAPIDGRTGIRQVDVGNIVHAADAAGLVVITTLRPINVVFTLPQQSLPAVQAAMAAGQARVQALAQGGPDRRDPGQRAGQDGPAVLDTGALTVVDNQVDQATGTIKLKASFANDALALWPGGFVNVRLLAETERGVVTVPPAAVQRGPNGAYVYVVAGDGTASRRPVTVGHEDAGVTVIADGLGAGDTVVVDGAARLTEGGKVSVAPGPGEAAPMPRDPAARRGRLARTP